MDSITLGAFDIILLRVTLLIHGATIAFSAEDRDIARQFAEVFDGKPIHGIKALRSATGWGLKECKETFERLFADAKAVPAPAIPSELRRELLLYVGYIERDVQAGERDHITDANLSTLREMINS